MNGFLLISSIVILVLTLMLFDLMSPAVLFTVPICVAVFICEIKQNEWGFDCSIATYVLIIIGLIAFNIGCYLGKMTFTPNYVANVEETADLSISKGKIVFFIIISLTSVAYVIKQVSSAVSAAGLSYKLFSTSLKTSYSTADHTYTVSGGSTALSIVTEIVSAIALCCLISLINRIYYGYKERKNILLIIPIVIYCIDMLLMGSRGNVINVLISALFIVYIQNYKKCGNKKRERRKLYRTFTISVVGILVLFYLLRSVVNKTGQENSSFFDIISGYVGANIDLLDRLVKSNSNISYPYVGYESLVPFYQFLQKIHLIDELPSVRLEYRFYNGFGCNVYTYFRRPYIDFGLVPAILVTFICGIICSWLYYEYVKVRNGNRKYMLRFALYAYFVSKIAMSFFDDYMTQLFCMNTVIKIVIIVITYEFTYRIRFYVGPKTYIRAINSGNPVDDIAMQGVDRS